ncbi:Protein ecdysoneless [Phytophthora citrophthora]|uniref:Protein ecdysoneless n=1 Tax=Phytophthora citrophthora TaxID=4793 RepID=A0AAD9G2B7_9STRA|nr:Protein ecdysoneless [Phytophthora citrophthora]
MELFPGPTVDTNETRYCFFLPASSQSQVDLNTAEQKNEAFLAFATQQTQGFLWHRHRFHLQARTTDTGRYILSGWTSVGDAIMDEWVVAKLVFDITKEFPGVVGRIVDSDGEFLLIESAEALPDWVTPEDSDRRVFVLNGKLHIAPPPAANQRGKEGALYDEDALLQVLDLAVKTEANAAVQRLIQHKLDEVPTYVRDNHHRVRCLLPEKAARVLAGNRDLVGPVVEAFYYREPKQAGLICGNMTKLMPPGDAVVEQSVVFSRAMYAQFKQQEFFPPKVFFRTDERYRVLEKPRKGEENTHPDAHAADIGVKLTCGLELLYAGEGGDQFGRPWKQIIDDLLQQNANLEAQPIAPDDDDSWLYMHPDTLESQLQRAAMAGSGTAPGGADELQNMAAMFGKFVDGVSGVEGVEGAEPVQFDMSSFMDILNGYGGSNEGTAGFDTDLVDEDGENKSDDDEFALDEAMAEMEAELAGTKVAQSFSRFERLNDEKEIQANETTEVGSASFSSAKPLDLDYNLLSNLLESFASQEGHAGPVSNILNEMNFPNATP